MHDDRVNCITYNAFAGQWDSITGNDEFGISAAWIDLDGHLSEEGLDNYEIYPTEESIRKYVKTYIDGKRFALALWDSNGNRTVYGFDSELDVLAEFNAYRQAFELWDV